MGERKSGRCEAGKDGLVSPVTEAVDTLGGRVHVRWDEGATATPMGQMAYFSEYLQITGIFDAWVADCPLAYTSPNAPTARDLLGSFTLSALAGHRRYAHISSLRADGVSAGMLGIERILSDDAVRRGFLHLTQDIPVPGIYAKTTVWMQSHLMRSAQPALRQPWVLDTDTTIKTLYGKQEGAQVSYNPHKPGRPSHAIHLYWMSPLRLVLDAAVQPGREHSASHSLPGLADLLRRLSPEERPFVVRGDSAFGNATVMEELENLNQRYLFKLKQTAGVKRLITQVFRSPDWQDAGQGWQGQESTLKLAGWSKTRRVIVLRRRIQGEIVLERIPEITPDTPDQTPTQLMLFDDDDLAYVRPWEYAVLITDLGYSIPVLAQLYRQRADCENGFDELKNQWGLSGFSTQDIARCELSARAVALVYNWWSWYARLAHPQSRLEAKTSRPLLLAAVGRMTQHAGQTHLVLTTMHAAGKTIQAMLRQIRAGLNHVLTTAPQLKTGNRMKVLIDYVMTRITAANATNGAPWVALGVG